MSTPRFASLAKGAQVSPAALAAAIADMSADDLKGALSADQLAALTPAPAAAASEDAGDKPKKMKGKGKKEEMEAEDAEYDDEDEMEAKVASDTAPLATAAEIGNAFMKVFPSASASQVLACIAITDRAKAAAPAASEPDEGTAELAALIKHNASNLDSGGGEAPKAKNHGWDEIHAEVQKLRGN